MSTPEDQRLATTMVAGLSSQLMTAALGMIALMGAWLTFAVDKKECGLLFWILTLASFACFVLSIVLGGKGTAILYKQGASGDWNYAKGDSAFQWQTIICFLGIFLFFSSVLVARKDKAPETSLPQEVAKISGHIEKQNSLIGQFLDQSRLDKNRFPTQEQFDKLKQEVEKLRTEMIHANGDEKTDSPPPSAVPAGTSSQPPSK